MSISFACSHCQTVMNAPDTAAGKRGKCKKCGEVMVIPAVAQKRCAGCGIDVSARPRTKNARGNYFCQSCWQTTNSAAQQIGEQSRRGARVGLNSAQSPATPVNTLESPPLAESSEFRSLAAPAQQIPRAAKNKRPTFRTKSVLALLGGVLAIWIVAAASFALYETHSTSHLIRGTWHGTGLGKERWVMQISSDYLTVTTPGDGTLQLTYRIVEEADESDSRKLRLEIGGMKVIDPLLYYDLKDDSITTELVGEQPDGSGTESVINASGRWSRQ